MKDMAGAIPSMVSSEDGVSAAPKKGAPFGGEIDDNFKAPKGKSSYDLDPDKGERPYKGHEAKEMAHHVVKAMDIIHHPFKSKAVQAHFANHKKVATTFDQLKSKIGADMEDQDG